MVALNTAANIRNAEVPDRGRARVVVLGSLDAALRAATSDGVEVHLFVNGWRTVDVVRAMVQSRGLAERIRVRHVSAAAVVRTALEGVQSRAAGA